MKQVYIKTYTSAGVFVKTITDFKIDGFTKQINQGIGQMNITLARQLDTFNTAGDFTLGNKVELYVTDEDTGSVPRKVYTGYIEQQRPSMLGNREQVDIVCMSVASKLAQDVLKDGIQTTLYTIPTDGLTTVVGSLGPAEVADVLEAIVDRFTEENPDINFNYNNDFGTSSIEVTGNTMEYTFQAMTYADAIKKVKEVAPQNWFWYIDEDETIYLRETPATATHTFTIGKNISRIEVTKGLDSVKNFFLLFASTPNIYKAYSDATSIAQYGRRVQIKTDANIESEDTMNNIGASFLAENKDARVRISMQIVDSNENEYGYDIESIIPGDTCKILGVSPGEDLFTDNMIIKEVEWTPDYVNLVIETRQDFDFDTFILNMKKKTEEQSVVNIPTTYTV